MNSENLGLQLSLYPWPGEVKGFVSGHITGGTRVLPPPPHAGADGSCNSVHSVESVEALAALAFQGHLEVRPLELGM